MALALLAGDAVAAQAPVGLGVADAFAVLSGTTVTNTGFSTLNGDLGVSPGSALTGFPPGTVNGSTHAADAVAASAQADVTAAYGDAAGRTPPIALPADVGGLALPGGVYRSGAALGLTGTVTLDGQGDPNAVFVFQVGSALTTAVASQVRLVNGAQSCNVSWQIASSATLGTSSVFAGNILALSSISINDGVTLNGRALARNGAVTLINDTITAPHCTPSAPPPGAGPTGGGPAGGGPTGSCPTSQPAVRRRPARPRLRAPRAGAHVRAGAVRFSWHPAARASRYTLIVDRQRMNTRCATRAVVRISAGSHSYRVLARNRHGARSSTVRAFAATSEQDRLTEQIRSDQGLKELERYANDAKCCGS